MQVQVSRVCMPEQVGSTQLVVLELELDVEELELEELELLVVVVLVVVVVPASHVPPLGTI